MGFKPKKILPWEGYGYFLVFVSLLIGWNTAWTCSEWFIKKTQITQDFLTNLIVQLCVALFSKSVWSWSQMIGMDDSESQVVIDECLGLPFCSYLQQSYRNQSLDAFHYYLFFTPLWRFILFLSFFKLGSVWVSLSAAFSGYLKLWR